MQGLNLPSGFQPVAHTQTVDGLIDTELTPGLEDQSSVAINQLMDPLP